MSPTQPIELRNKGALVKAKASGVTTLFHETGHWPTRVHAETIAMSEACALLSEELYRYLGHSARIRLIDNLMMVFIN